MTRWLLAVLLALAWPCLASDPLPVLAPVLESGRVQQRPAPDGRPVPVVQQVHDGPVHAGVQREAREGFTAQILALDVLARGLAAPERREPAWLYLSPEDGGFARHGFFLRDDEGVRYVDAPYVDLVVDEASLADGSFEEIFAHEMGHVFLRRLFPSLPAGYSRTPHHAYSLTDYPTALDEGFAIHFQLLSRRLTANTRLRETDQGFDARPFLPHWQSNRDRLLRIQGVRANLFVHAQRPLDGDRLDDARLSPEFASATLRNGPQMLSSEGVVATLFHRWVGPVEAGDLAAAYRPWFMALRRLDAAAPGPDAPLVPELLRALHAIDPQRGRDAIGLFIDTTYGLTESPTLQAQAEALALAGARGDIESFVAGLGPARRALSQVRDAALADPRRLAAALGPALWLSSEDGSLTLNLNTAGQAELESLGLAPPAASALLACRRTLGVFDGFDVVSACPGLPAPVGDWISSHREAMEGTGPYLRR